MQDATWRMMAWISLMISLSLFSLIALRRGSTHSSHERQNTQLSNSKRNMEMEDGYQELVNVTHPFWTTSESVSMLKFQRSSTSEVAWLMITSTILCSFPASSHSASEIQTNNIS
jgi:hypothetical protein